jgi:hypothetical protein
MILVVDLILRLLMWGWREAHFGEDVTCLSHTTIINDGQSLTAGREEQDRAKRVV